MNTENLGFAWLQVCNKIKEYEGVNPSFMDAIFSRIQPQAMSDSFLVLSTDNTFIKSKFEQDFLPYTLQALKSLYACDFTIMMDIFEGGQSPSPLPQTSPSSSFPSQAAQTAAALVSEEAKQQGVPLDDKTLSEGEENYEEGMSDDMPNEYGIVPLLTFDNFVIGESNRMAYSLALSVAEKPGGNTFTNPLFIYGKSGLGKTHLLRAIQNYINSTNPALSVIYTDSADLLSDYVNAGAAREKEKNSYNNFKKKYEEADVLLIDDIQFLQGKKQTLDIVFQIFKKMIDRGSQVILSADRAPKNIDIDERYHSRFNAGGTIDIQPPELETKLAIINSYVEEYNLKNDGINYHLPEDIQLYIAQISSSNIRELKSAVTKILLNLSLLNKQSVSLYEVKEMLENHFSGGPSKRLSIADVMKEVEAFYKIPHDDLISKRRSREISHARQVSMYLCYQMLEVTQAAIGEEFGRDHSTVVYSVNSIEEKMKNNRELREEIDVLIQNIRES